MKEILAKHNFRDIEDEELEGFNENVKVVSYKVERDDLDLIVTFRNLMAQKKIKAI